MVVLKTDSFHVLLPRCCRPPLCSSSPTVHWSLEPVAYPRCLLEFDAHIARQAVDVHDLAAAIEGSFQHVTVVVACDNLFEKTLTVEVIYNEQI